MAGSEFVALIRPETSTTFKLLYNDTISSTAIVGSVNGALSNTIIRYTFNIKVPIVGWTANWETVLAANGNYDWTSYTPAFSGWTPTGVECFHARDNSDLLLRCKFTAGSVAASEARVGFPTGLTSADTSKIPSITTVGKYSYNNTGASTVKQGSVLVEPSVSYVTFALDDYTTASGPFAKQNGNVIAANGVLFAFPIIRIPIQGWQTNQNAPILIGSVTSGSASPERIERAAITGSATTPTIASQSGSWLSTTITRNGIGDYSFTINPGVFSGTPVCTYASTLTSLTITSAVQARFVSISSTALRILQNNQSSGPTNWSGVDTDYMITCIGPR